jgi:hypothetical protein
VNSHIHWLGLAVFVSWRDKSVIFLPGNGCWAKLPGTIMRFPQRRCLDKKLTVWPKLKLCSRSALKLARKRFCTWRCNHLSSLCPSAHLKYAPVLTNEHSGAMSYLLLAWAPSGVS